MMNKKQRNRKNVKQNKRNRIINRRYSSTIKSLSKLFTTKVKGLKIDGEETDKMKLKSETAKVITNLYSIIDKAVKKGVIHKNTAARKKSRVGKIFIKL
jgi:small subunit ribosomal protein S20